MPTHYGHTPGSFNADTIRRLAGPGGAAASNKRRPPIFGSAEGRAFLNSASSQYRQSDVGAARLQLQRQTTDLSAGRDPFAGRTLLSGSAGGTSNPRQAGGAAVATGRTGTPAFGNPAVGRTLLNSATSQSRQSSSRSISVAPPTGDFSRQTGSSQPLTLQQWHIQREKEKQRRATLTSDQRREEFLERRYGAEKRYQAQRQADLQAAINSPNSPYRAPAGAVYNPRNNTWEADGVVYTKPPAGTADPGQSAGDDFQFNTPDPGAATSAPVATAAPDIPQLGRITPYRSVAPDPGSSATLARPEAPNVDPLTLPEARQRTVANRSQDLGHLQSARSRSSVRGPRGSFNMADTARRTLLGSL